MSELGEAMKLRAAMVLGTQARARVGLVSGTQISTTNKQTVKVLIQPEDVETGWLPVLSPFVGNGWGLVIPLIHGAQVLVLFQEDDPNNGIVIGAMFSVMDQLPIKTMQDGEFWLVHKSGSLLSFTNDGKVAVTSASDMNFTAGGDMNLNASGQINLGADTNVTGTLSASVDVQGGPSDISLINHEHSAVETGSGISGPPVP